MSAVVVSDATPLNYLVLINAVEVLPRLFSAVLIPPAVAAELSSGSGAKLRNSAMNRARFNSSATDNFFIGFEFP